MNTYFEVITIISTKLSLFESPLIDFYIKSRKRANDVAKSGRKCASGVVKCSRKREGGILWGKECLNGKYTAKC